MTYNLNVVQFIEVYDRCLDLLKTLVLESPNF